MKGKYNDSPIHNLCYRMHNEFEYYMTFKDEIYVERGYNEIDDLLMMILLNNGCKSSDKKPHYLMINIIPNEYQICFITGMIGNDANEYYDFLIFNGMKVLVIFLDYFNNIIDKYVDEDDPLYQLKISIGNSVYYDAIKKIVEVFYLTSEPMPGGLLTTSMATTQRWNQSIIAIDILNIFKPIDENDVSDIPIEDIEKILDGNIKLQLYGIRTM